MRDNSSTSRVALPKSFLSPAGMLSIAGLVLLTICSSAVALAADVTVTADAQPGRFETLLRPVRDGGQAVTAIEVRSVIHGPVEPDSGPLSITAPIVYAGVPGIADRVEGLQVTDRDGTVPLSQTDDAANPGGFPYFRHWKAERDVVFPVKISYRSRVRHADGVRGPPFCIRPSDGGVSGAGSGFLVLPENVASTTSVVRWDLDDLANGSRAVTSFGEGDFELPGAPEELMQGWYMAGPIETYPDSGDDEGFSASWLGKYPFDAKTEMERAGQVYTWLGDFFGHLKPPPRYRVFMRVIDDPSGRTSGTALTNSFMLSRGPITAADEAGEAPRSTFFHEMIHLWVGGIEGPQGVTSWFGEGLTSYYTDLLPMLGGFETVAEYGEGVNENAKTYYTNEARNWTAEQIAEVGFGNELARRTPYQRGALYFADLDARIRVATHGEANLHTFVREIFRKRENDDGFVFDHDKWMELIEAQIGPSAREQFQDVIINGETIVPASDAFGPCFERQPAKYLTEAGAEVDGYQWIRVESVPDETCRAYAAPKAEPEYPSFAGYSVSTRHSGLFHGVRVDYVATFDDTIITNEVAEETASIYATSYIRDDVADPDSRPIIFIWSGGPSASSQTLHMAGFGPRRLVVPRDVSAAIAPPYAVTDNVHTVLDVADLVFVDPAGTGFSRILPDGDESHFYSAAGDAESVAQFMRKWLTKNHRLDSPIYILGSSYGSIRAALVAGLLAETTTPLDGAILFSQGVNLVETTQRNNNIIGYASNLSQQAAIAWYHGRTSLHEQSVAQVIDEAQAFAMGEYLVALTQGRFLDEADRGAIASRMAELTGVSSAYYVKNDLMIKKSQFRSELLRDRGLVIGATDARYTAPADSEQGPSNPTQGVPEVQLEHMQNFLGITLPMEQYRGFAPDTGNQWDYGGTSTLDGSELAPDTIRTVFADFDFPRVIAPAFEANEEFRVMIATGIYDLLTTVGPARLLASNPAYPANRIEMHDYVGGHAFYASDDDFERLANDVRTFAGREP